MRFLVIVLGFFIISCQEQRKHGPNPEILIETTAGDMEFELFPEQAPQTVAAFLKNIEKDIYSNSSF